MSEWQPIETAGAYHPAQSLTAIVGRFEWIGGDGDSEPEIYGRYVCVAYRFSDGWAVGIGGATIGGSAYLRLNVQPTHWMPLPAPPEPTA